jgi:hypothetical protein
MEVDDNTSLIVVNPQGILDQQLRHRLIHLLNTFIIAFILINYIKLYLLKFFKLMNIIFNIRYGLLFFKSETEKIMI